VRRYLSTACLLFLLPACNNSTSIPEAVQPTDMVATHAASTSTPVSNIYEQGVHLFDYDAESPLLITELSVQQEDGYTLHDIKYPSPKTGNVPAYLLVPQGAGPFAGLILMHGSSGSRETLLSFARDLVITGAVVLTLICAASLNFPRLKPWNEASSTSAIGNVRISSSKTRARARSAHAFSSTLISCSRNYRYPPIANCPTHLPNSSADMKLQTIKEFTKNTNAEKQSGQRR